jgi:serine/threonine-protein kinase
MVRIIVDAARGLHAAHELKRSDGELLGVVHRDISPQNIFVLYEGQAKVLDFGVAKLRDRSGDTKSSEIKGKLSYMSPEQFRNEKLDRRSDVWALGVVLWEATVGQKLFERENQGALVYSVLEEDVPLPSSVAKTYPPELEKVVMKALERDREERYETAAAFASDLEAYLYSEFDPAGPEQVGKWLSGIFADRLAARNVLLRSEELPIGTVPQVDLGAEADGRMSLEGVVEASHEEEARWRPSLPMIAGGVVAMLVLVWLVVAFGPWGDDSGGERVAQATTSPTQKLHNSPDAASSRPDVSVNRAGDGGTTTAPNDSPDAMQDVSPDLDFSATVADAGGGADAEIQWQDAESPPVESSPVDSPPEETKVASVTPRNRPRSTTRPKQRQPTRPRETQRDTTPTQSTGGQRGKLSLMAIPPAEVHVGGRPIGRTPLFNVELPPGRHRLRLRAIDGSGSKTITVQIKAGQVVRRSVRL